MPSAHQDRLALVGVWPLTDARDWCGEWQPSGPSAPRAEGS